MHFSGDITVVKFVKDHVDYKLLSKLHDQFNKLIVLCPENLVKDIQQSFLCFSYSQIGRVAALNKVIEQIDTRWILYLNETEVDCSISFEPVENNAYVAEIEQLQFNQNTTIKYEVRLIPVSEKLIFKGYDLPDIYDVFQQNNWKLAEQTFSIKGIKEKEGISAIDPDKEIANFKNSSKARLKKAIELVGKQELKKAISYFQQALKYQKLFNFDYVAALNGLADALVEENRWQEAKSHVELSLLEEPDQRMPHLVLYKIAHLNRNWEEAVEHLENYLNNHEKVSRANFDVYLKKEECHFLIADAASRGGDYEQALKHYEQYYRLKNRDVDKEIIKKLFLYSIELADEQNAIQYFMDLFGDYIPDLLNANRYQQVHEALSLFIERGWTDFPCKIYEMIYKENNTGDDQILHHWIAALIKADKVKKAQKILANARKKVS